MQTNDNLYNLSKGNMRRITWRVSISFPRDYNSSITFFKVGDAGSTIGGPDSLSGSGALIQEWDKYTFTEYTSRVIDVSCEQEKDFPYSVVAGTADVTFNNYDDFFDPNGTSSIAPYVLPYRPIKIWMGFDDEYVLVFSGLTEKMPVLDEKTKTASFHCISFLSYLFDKTLDTLPLYTNARTDTVLDGILQAVGLTSGQYVLDTGLNTLGVYFAPSGATFASEVKPLMEAESGTLMMDELGVIRFKNRQNIGTNIVHAFESHRDIVDVISRRDDDLINTVTIKSDVRTLQVNQSIWTASEAQLIGASTTLTVWADLTDPVSTADTPVLDALTGSAYTVNTASDGAGTASADVTVTSTTIYGSSVKIVFSNASTASLYITSVTLYGTPYKVTDNVYVRETNAASVAKFGERLYEITNNNFQSDSVASSKALMIIDDNDEYGVISEVKVKGTPQFQLDDLISIDVEGRLQTGSIWKIQMGMSLGGGFEQTLALKEYTRRTYFSVGTGGSQVGGSDYISY